MEEKVEDLKVRHLEKGAGINQVSKRSFCKKTAGAKAGRCDTEPAEWQPQSQRKSSSGC